MFWTSGGRIQPALPAELHTRWASSAWPTDLPPPPRGVRAAGLAPLIRRACMFSYMARAARTQTEPVEAGLRPKPLRFLVRGGLVKEYSTSPP